MLDQTDFLCPGECEVLSAWDHWSALHPKEENGRCDAFIAGWVSAHNAMLQSKESPANTAADEDIMAQRLMAACAQHEVIDVLNGGGDVELAKKSLRLLCEMVASALPLRGHQQAKPAIKRECINCKYVLITACKHPDGDKVDDCFFSKDHKLFVAR